MTRYEKGQNPDIRGHRYFNGNEPVQSVAISVVILLKYDQNFESDPVTMHSLLQCMLGSTIDSEEMEVGASGLGVGKRRV